MAYAGLLSSNMALRLLQLGPVGLLAAAVATFGASIVGRLPEHVVTRESDWHAPEFRGLDQDGRPFDDRALRGRPWIASFIFTRCTTACPAITAKVRLLQRCIPDPEVRFVSFSVDPGFDSPAVLHDHAGRWSPDPRWTLVSTTPEMLERVAAGLRVAVEDPL